MNGVVIANGIADSDGDVLDKKDIKTIFTKYQRDTDTMHTNIKNEGVEVFASWISEIDTTMDGKSVPSGSWMATFKITNPTLIKCISDGKLNGLSLGSVSKEAMTPKYWFIGKSLNYRDIKDIEDVIPLFISFVDKPANQYGFEVMTYDAYINKNEKKLDVEEMTETNEEMISVSALEKLKDIFSITKAEEEPVPEEVTEESSADETVTALFEKLDMIIEQNNQILEAINKEEENVDEEEEIEKAEEDEEDSEEAEDEEIEKAEESEEEEKEEDVEKSESEEEEKKDEDASINKRETSMIEKSNTQSKTTFYQNTGRDHLGRKIRN